MMATVPNQDMPALKLPRLRTLDGARGIALLFMITAHGTALFMDPGQPARAYTMLVAILFFAKIATPLFMSVFGATMAYVYLEQIHIPGKFNQLKLRLWKRAGWVFLAHQFLVLVVDLGEDKPAGFILKRLLFLQTGSWIEILNCYLVLLLISPWLMRAWKSMPAGWKAGLMVTLYVTGRLLSGLAVPEWAQAMKNIFVGYAAGDFNGMTPDTFPVFQLSFFYFGGLLWGEYLTRVMRARSWRNMYAAGLGIAVLAFIASVLIAQMPPAQYVTAIAYDRFKYPPNLPYVLYGVAGALAISLACFWLVEQRFPNHPASRILEALGRNSLFTYNLQYVLLFTVAGQGLHLLKQQTLAVSIIATLGVMLICLAAAPAWESFKFRIRNR